MSQSDKRRAEIDAKRAKIEDIRRARAERQKAQNDRRASEVMCFPALTATSNAESSRRI